MYTSVGSYDAGGGTTSKRWFWQICFGSPPYKIINEINLPRKQVPLSSLYLRNRNANGKAPGVEISNYVRDHAWGTDITRRKAALQEQHSCLHLQGAGLSFWSSYTDRLKIRCFVMVALSAICHVVFASRFSGTIPLTSFIHHKAAEEKYFHWSSTRNNGSGWVFGPKLSMVISAALSPLRWAVLLKTPVTHPDRWSIYLFMWFDITFIPHQHCDPSCFCICFLTVHTFLTFAFILWRGRGKRWLFSSIKLTANHAHLTIL